MISVGYIVFHIELINIPADIKTILDAVNWCCKPIIVKLLSHRRSNSANR